ncbi:MAG: hypothetical protein VCB42_02755, partial [Myxococcota bacterium]
MVVRSGSDRDSFTQWIDAHAAAELINRGEGLAESGPDRIPAIEKNLASLVDLLGYSARNDVARCKLAIGINRGHESFAR